MPNHSKRYVFVFCNDFTEVHAKDEEEAKHVIAYHYYDHINPNNYTRKEMVKWVNFALNNGVIHYSEMDYVVASSKPGYVRWLEKLEEEG